MKGLKLFSFRGWEPTASTKKDGETVSSSIQDIAYILCKQTQKQCAFPGLEVPSHLHQGAIVTKEVKEEETGSERKRKEKGSISKRQGEGTSLQAGKGCRVLLDCLPLCMGKESAQTPPWLATLSRSAPILFPASLSWQMNLVVYFRRGVGGKAVCFSQWFPWSPTEKAASATFHCPIVPVFPSLLPRPP